MTNVLTSDEGPNGKKIEGHLYSCKKKDEVDLVSLCHDLLMQLSLSNILVEVI